MEKIKALLHVVVGSGAFSLSRWYKQSIPVMVYTVLKPKRLLTIKWAQSSHHLTPKRGQLWYGTFTKL
jgi:hypothetical protein